MRRRQAFGAIRPWKPYCVDCLRFPFYWKRWGTRRREAGNGVSCSTFGRNRLCSGEDETGVCRVTRERTAGWQLGAWPGGGRAKVVGDGREFLEYGLCSRCGLAGTFTDCLYNGIVSTMADSSTALIAKQTFSNGVWQGLWRACCPNESLGATRQSAPLGILVILDVCRRLLLANPPIHLLCRMCDGEKVTVGEGA